MKKNSKNRRPVNRLTLDKQTLKDLDLKVASALRAGTASPTDCGCTSVCGDVGPRTYQPGNGPTDACANTVGFVTDLASTHCY